MRCATDRRRYRPHVGRDRLRARRSATASPRSRRRTAYSNDEPLQYEVVFLTPDSVYEDVVIELTVSTEHETVLRFQLAPRE